MRGLLLVVLVGLASLEPAGAQEAQTTPFVERARIEIPALRAAPIPPVWTADGLIVAQLAPLVAPVFRAFSRTGDRMAEFTLAIPGASMIIIPLKGFALGFDGSLGAAGSLYWTDSTEGAFVAWVSADGEQRAVARLAVPPDAVTAAADGTIWVSTPRPREDSAPDADFPVILRFDKSGAPHQDDTAVVRPQDVRPVPDPMLPRGLARSRRLVLEGGARAYLEFSLDGRLLDRFAAADESRGHAVDSVALCADGSLYAGVAVLSGSGLIVGQGIYRLDRHERIWRYIPMPRPFLLFGCGGSQLVALTDPSTVSWLQPTGP